MITKEEIIELARKAEYGEELEEIEIQENKIFAFDGDREHVVRFPETIEKVPFLTKIIETVPKSINKEKLINLLSKLDDELFLTVEKIIVFETEEEYEDIMYNYFDNTDMIDLDHEVGKFLYYENYILINLHLIKKTAIEMSSTEEEYKREVNIGIWVTLIHELRHVYQHSFISGIEDEIEDEIEEDAEEYGIECFEREIKHKDYYIF